MSQRRSVIHSIKDTSAGLLEWFSFSNYLNEDTFTVRRRFYRTIAFLVFFLCSFFNFLTDLYSSFAITSMYAILTVFVRRLIDWGKPKTAYYSLLFITTSSLMLLCYVEGLRSGIFLFFFPCIFNFAFLTDFVGRKSTLFTYVVFLSALCVCLLVCPEVTDLQEMSESLYRMNFMSNIGISFILISWMSFSLARENQRSHGILQNKEVFLNTIFNTSMQGEIIVDMETGLITNYNHHSSFLFGPNDPTYILMGRNACDLFIELSQEGGEKIYEEIYNPLKNWEGELTCVR